MVAGSTLFLLPVAAAAETQKVVAEVVVVAKL
jgi:hypothetical protein